MKLHILSDLHLEFGHFDLPDVERDILIIAGDIHYSRAVEKYLKKYSEKSVILFVAGNHEYYNNDICKKASFLRSIRAHNIYFLDNGYFQYDGITFVGCTLWSDMNRKDPTVFDYIYSKMNDYHIISRNEISLQPEDTVRLHDFSVGYLNHCLSKFDPQKTVIITHHAPSFESTNCWKADDPIKYAYASDLHWLIEKYNPLLWIHGHIHCNYDYYIGKTRILFNPRGYYPDSLNDSFKPDFIVNI
jgi:Icc-related predicted phosphoesterase